MRITFAAAALWAVVECTPWNGDAVAPRQVHLAFTEDSSGILFSWTTGTPMWAPPPPAGTPNATSPAVRYGTAPTALTATATSDYSLSYGGIGDVTHRVNVSGLAQRTRYFYAVGDVALDVWSPTFSFLSRPAAGKDEVLDVRVNTRDAALDGASVSPPPTPPSLLHMATWAFGTAHQQSCKQLWPQSWRAASVSMRL